MKSKNIGLKLTRTLEIDELIAGLTDLIADYQRLSTDVGGNTSPAYTKNVERLKAFAAEVRALESTVDARDEVVSKVQEFMLGIPFTTDVDAIFRHVDQHKSEMEEKVRLDPAGFRKMIFGSYEFISQEREKTRALLFKRNEPLLSELLADYERIATDSNGMISPVRQWRIKRMRELLFTLRDRTRYERRASSPDGA
jgi:hypothetical protein